MGFTGFKCAVGGPAAIAKTKSATAGLKCNRVVTGISENFFDVGGTRMQNPDGASPTWRSATKSNQHYDIPGFDQRPNCRRYDFPQWAIGNSDRQVGNRLTIPQIVR